MNQSLTILESENFYSNLTKWDSAKYATLFFKIILTITGNVLLYGVIWYECFSADLRYRTLMNQMLSHLCILHICEGPVFMIGFVIYFCFDEHPENFCHIIAFAGRLLFLCSLTQLTLRQLIKYYCIFHRKHCFNDDFAAVFLLTANVMLSNIFEFVTYFFGHHNAEINFHCCTGRKPSENIARTMNYMKNNGNSTITHVWFNASLGPGVYNIMVTFHSPIRQIFGKLSLTEKAIVILV